MCIDRVTFDIAGSHLFYWVELCCCMRIVKIIYQLHHLPLPPQQVERQTPPPSERSVHPQLKNRESSRKNAS